MLDDHAQILYMNTVIKECEDAFDVCLHTIDEDDIFKLKEAT